MSLVDLVRGIREVMPEAIEAAQAFESRPQAAERARLYYELVRTVDQCFWMDDWVSDIERNSSYWLSLKDPRVAKSKRHKAEFELSPELAEMPVLTQWLAVVFLQGVRNTPSVGEDLIEAAEHFWGIDDLFGLAERIDAEVTQLETTGARSDSPSYAETGRSTGRTQTVPTPLPPPIQEGVTPTGAGAAEPPESFLIERPDVVLIRFKTDEQGSVTLELPSEGVEVEFNEPYTQGRVQLLQLLQTSVEPGTYDGGLQAQVGANLYPSLLPRKIGAAMARAKAAAAPYNRPATVQLAFDEGALSAVQLPWELLHDGSSHVVGNESVRLNRHITYYGDRTPFQPVDPLRVLYIESRPTDTGELPDLTQSFRDAIARLSGRVQTDFIRSGDATFANFESAVRSGGYHIVHFDGHGSNDEVVGKGSLIFEDGSRGTDSVSADRMAAALAGSGVRLAVLAACLGSRVGGAGMFKSVAPALIRAKVPAVVANQFSVWTDAMAAFDYDFYASLARGESISAAVADGRRAMTPMRGQFFLPTLYLRVADGEGYLFSGEPETHRQFRQNQMAMLAAWWWAMTELQRAIYLEGILRENGREVLPPPPTQPPPQRPPIEERPPSVPERPEQPEAPPERTEMGMPDLSGTYEVYGWWSLHAEQEAQAGRFLTPPRRISVAHSGSTVSVNAVSGPANDRVSFSGTIEDATFANSEQIGWQWWHEYGGTIYFHGPWSKDWMEGYWTGQTTGWRRSTTAFDQGAVGFSKLSDEYWEHILEGLQAQVPADHNLRLPANVRHPVVVVGVDLMMYVRI